MVSLKVTVPLVLLVFAGVLSTGNVLYHVPQAEQVAQEDSRKRLAQELSRLQSTIEYLLLKDDAASAQQQIAVLAHNHDVIAAALTDDHGRVLTATRRAWVDRPIAEVLPELGLQQVGGAMQQHRPAIEVGPRGESLIGTASVLIGGERDELRPTRTGALLVAYDLVRYKAEARSQVVRQALSWAGWVIALALAMWAVFHVLLTRRTARLMRAAEQLAAGQLDARSGLSGDDELGRLGRAFDAMARQVTETQTRLREDIAERERVQRELEASDDRLQQILNNSSAVIFARDAEDRFLFVNREWERVFRKKSADVVGRLDKDVRGEELSAVYRAHNEQVLARNMTLVFEETLELDDGLHTYISIKFPLHDADGTAYGVCGIATDITDRKRAQADLARERELAFQREKLAALGSLLAGVAHELNNPLSVVVARAVLLEEQGNPAAQAAAAKIRSAAERCARIVRTFLAMARQQPPQRGPVAIPDVVSAALDIANYALRSTGIEVRVDLPPDLPPIDADADQLHQVLLNLLINAQHALQDVDGPRQVRIGGRHERHASRLLITVADNGPGIPEELRARVFEPYFTTKPTGVGTGVGLAVSLGIIESHGGTLTVEPAPGGGAAFVIALPVATTRSAGAVARTASPPSTDSRTILVVDDEAEVRETLAEILTRARHRVTMVSSGSEALEQLAGHRFDVIFADMRMPHIDGRALYGEIEKRWPDQASRVVFVTGDMLTTTLREFIAASGRRLIEKPFLPSDVRRVVVEMTA